MFIDTNALRANRKDGGARPVIVCDGDGGRTVSLGLSILDGEGREVARLVYDPDNPHSGTAEVWVEAEKTALVHSG